MGKEWDLDDSAKNTSEDKALENSAGVAPYILRQGEKLTPFIFAAPHSGRFYPLSFIEASRLSAPDLRISEDAWVDKLFGGAVDSGATLLVATYGRSYVDLNRSADELDASMFTPKLDTKDLDNSHRVKAGLGMVPRVVAPGMPLYDHPLPAREADFRTKQVHEPYHEKLKSLIDVRRKHFGYAILIDCHSMPSEAHTEKRFVRWGRTKNHGNENDIVLGDRWGNSCGPDLTNLVDSLFKRAGFNVRRNIPYAGGYATRHYGAPAQGVHALQIEIARGLYMNEETLEPLSGFDTLRETMTDFCAKLITELRLTHPLAAE